MSSPVDPNAAIRRTEQAEAVEEVSAQVYAKQVEVQEELSEDARDVYNFFAQMRAGAKPIEERTEKRTKEAEKVSSLLSVLLRKDMEDLAEGFSERDDNKPYRFDKTRLALLAQALGVDITGATSLDEILEIVTAALTIKGQAPDVAQIDKALDFLLEVSNKKLGELEKQEKEAQDPKVKEGLTNAVADSRSLIQQLQATKQVHNERHKQAIETGHEFIELADTVVKLREGKLTDLEKVSTPEALDRIRGMIFNPQELTTIFGYYQSKGYTFKEIRDEVRSILNYLGDELKVGDIEPAKLNALMKETRRSQAILQIFRHFNNRMKLIESLCEMQGVDIPPSITLDRLAIQFMKVVDDRYPEAKRIDQNISGLIAGG